MKKISFDSGVQEFQINDNGVLRFNPSDPNVYRRFFEAKDHIGKYAEEYEKKAEEYEKKLVEVENQQPDERSAAEIAFAEMAAIDKKVKAELTYVFGAENDFDKILGGVSLLAVTKTGYVITNLFAALLPIIEQGAKDQAQAKVTEIKANREMRRAMMKNARE